MPANLINSTENLSSDEYFTLADAAARLGLCTKTLTKFLKANPRQPPLYARVGRHYLIATSDLVRMCGGVSVQ